MSFGSKVVVRGTKKLFVWPEEGDVHEWERFVGFEAFHKQKKLKKCRKRQNCPVESFDRGIFSLFRANCSSEKSF